LRRIVPWQTELRQPHLFEAAPCSVYQSHWMSETPLDAIRADPTCMAQGIMTLHP
jgi:hypothetical protein